MIDLTVCPECGEAAEIEWRAVLESSDGPVEHCRVRCVRGHWFLMPAAMLASGRPAPRRGRSRATPRPDR